MPNAGTLEIADVVSKLVVLLWSVGAALLVVHVLLTVTHYQIFELPWMMRELFDVDEEESVPTWFSSAILLITSIYLFYVSHLKRLGKDAHTNAWRGLACGFLFLSIDEVAGFHEAINSIMDQSWAVPGAFLSLFLLVLFTRLLRSLPSQVSRNFAIAGAIYVGGAIGVELATEPYLYNDQLDTLAYNLWTVVEEGMEMSGVVYFLSALNQYVAD